MSTDEIKDARAAAQQLSRNWSLFDDAQKAYMVHQAIEELGEEEARGILMILVKKDETEYKRLKEMKIGLTLEIPLPEPSTEFETASSVANPSSLRIGPFPTGSDKKQT